MPSNNNLVIYPLESSYKLAKADQFLAYLSGIGFVGGHDNSDESKPRLLPGELFMKHLTFLGCSPSVGTRSDDGKFNSYSVELITSNKKPVLIASKRVRAPECPGCRKQEINDRAYQQIRIETRNSTWHCANCGKHYSVADINWRHKLAIATDYVVIHGVFEGEVIPSDKFLDQLAGESGVSWSYCYC